MPSVTLTIQTLNLVMGYLAKQPWENVNSIINGDMRIDQRNAGALHTLSGSATYYLDRWYALSAGANATAQRVAGTTSQNIYRFNGAAGVTGIYMGQKIESSNVYDLAGGTATLSVDLSNNLLTTVSWNAYYANSADNFSGLTYIAGGDITVNATASRYSVQIALPAGAANGIRIEFGVGAQTSGKWTIGNVQLEKSTVATPFEFRPYGAELVLCQRYYQIYNDGNGANIGVGYCSNTTTCYPVFYFAGKMRAIPSFSYTGGITIGGYDTATAIALDSASTINASIRLTGSGLAAYQARQCWLNASSSITFSSEL